MKRAAWTLVGLLALAPALARDGVQVGPESPFAQMVPAQQVEAESIREYRQMLQQYHARRAVATDDNPQLVRLRAIASRLIPFAYEWNPRARDWHWEVNLLRSNELNAFCMPGGKIAVYFGLLQQLQLSDDEIAMVMGHEMAHALREHARERMGKTLATHAGANLASALLGLGTLGNTVLGAGTQLLTLQFSREDESEADLVGMDLAAHAGYDPRAAVTLWQKMIAASKGAPPQFLSTHPSGPTRVHDLQAALPQVLPVYERAPKPERRFAPPKKP